MNEISAGRVYGATENAVSTITEGLGLEAVDKVRVTGISRTDCSSDLSLQLITDWLLEK